MKAEARAQTQRAESQVKENYSQALRHNKNFPCWILQLLGTNNPFIPRIFSLYRRIPVIGIIYNCYIIHV